MDVIFDVDGTLLDIQHRIHLIRPQEGGKKDWRKFRAQAVGDSIIWPIAAILTALYQAGHRIIIVTGRTQKERPQLQFTLKLIQPYDLPLYMRKDGDMRPDHVVKLEMLLTMRETGYSPELAFEDRQQVVDMWRREGLYCCQVAPGQF